MVNRGIVAFHSLNRPDAAPSILRHLAASAWRQTVESASSIKRRLFYPISSKRHCQARPNSVLWIIEMASFLQKRLFTLSKTRHAAESTAAAATTQLSPFESTANSAGASTNLMEISDNLDQLLAQIGQDGTSHPRYVKCGL
jgi:hypothetical protein